MKTLVGKTLTLAGKEEFLKGLPELYSNDEEENPIAVKKVVGIFLPWEWYIFEGSSDGIMFAFVKGNFEECGSVSYGDLLEVGGVEVTDFKPTRLNDLMSNE